MSIHKNIYEIFVKNFPELAVNVQKWSPAGKRKIKMVCNNHMPVTFEYIDDKNWTIESGGSIS